MNTREEATPVIDPEPGGRAPAPGQLRLVQQFVNTNDREAGRDSLDSPQCLQDWFTHWTGWDSTRRPTTTEHRQALVLREGLRWMAAPDVLARPAELDQVVRDLHLQLTLAADNFALDGPTPTGRALAPILEAARTARADGTWSRLKVCARDQCQWLYYDSSRNTSARWCATDICGSREKARRAYRRKAH